MRPDISKVIVERPRTGGDGGKSHEPKGYKKKLEKALRDETGDQTWDHESNSPHRKHGWNAKEFSERLGPLRKFLRSKVDQPWDEVWSEICANLKADSVVQSHVRDHIGWDVELDVVMINNMPVHTTKEYGVYSPFYVNPDTGILCETPKGKRHKWKGYPKQYVPGKDDMHQYHVINGVWYEIELAPFPEQVKNHQDIVIDILLNHVQKIWGASRHDCIRKYGREVYGIRKRQLNSKEIKKLKLWETDVGINAREEMEKKSSPTT